MATAASPWPRNLSGNRKAFLVIEDETDIAELIALHLQDLDAEVVQVHNGQAGFEKALAKTWDALILDLRLPGMDGIDVCRQLRASGFQSPILMLTARSTELDRVLGLEIGADDYMTKPFSALELQARIKALLRRSLVSQQAAETPSHNHMLRFGNLVICPRERRAELANQPLELTAKEFDLLCFFAEHPGVVFRRSDLLDKVWGYHHQGYEHTVNSHINRLRSKLEKDPGRPDFIHTVWGVGYRFVNGEGNA